ncbi:NAD(P)-binding domain-containing protein [Nakamurella sp. GG22]
MSRTEVVVIGAGQSGLAVSALLTARSVDHVVLERGGPAERWRSERWDSLRLLTPNWMSRLPGWSYRGPDPDGYMAAGQVAGYLLAYADSFGAPIITGAAVRTVRTMATGGYRVVSDAGTFAAPAVVVATGYCDVAARPAYSRRLAPDFRQLDAGSYRRTSDAGDGVLVVGASATGVQLADELVRSGRHVLLAVGRHTRLPRSYRGMDIMRWLDSLGTLQRPLDPNRPRRHEPSLQLVGRPAGYDVDLPSLVDRGVRLTGRVIEIDGGTVDVADDLAITTDAADRRLERLLQRIDRHAAGSGLDREVAAAHRPRPSSVIAANPARRIDLKGAGIDTVLWATGYRRSYPWLQVPGVVGPDGEIRHRGGRTPAAGLIALGLAQQTRMNSTFLDGVRHDAGSLVEHLCRDVLPGAERMSA